MWSVWLSSGGSAVIAVSVSQPSCKLTLVHSLTLPEATCFSFISQSESSIIVDTRVSPSNDIINSLWMQETLEDIDKNGDGHVDEDEYIGKFK